MAVTVRRPFANGLELLANYTWSRATDTDQVQGNFGTFYGGDIPLDPNNIRAENGLSDIDVRNRFVLSFVYQPHLFKDNKWVKHIVDGFMFSGSDIASAVSPSASACRGTVFNGWLPVTAIGAAGNIYGGAMSSSTGVGNHRPSSSDRTQQHHRPWLQQR